MRRAFYYCYRLVDAVPSLKDAISSTQTQYLRQQKCGIFGRLQKSAERGEKEEAEVKVTEMSGNHPHYLDVIKTTMPL